jgi:O-acetylserine/cysteine efflux transporter
MPFRDFALLALVCAIWANHGVVTKILVTNTEVQPLVYAMLRFILVAALLFPWLKPVPRPFWPVALVSVFMGGVGFVFFFIAVKTTSPSAVAVVSQIGVPMTTLLSVLVLGEVIRWRRMLGIALTVVGVVILVWRPGEVAFSAGLLLVILNAAMGATGVIFMKRIVGVTPMQFQAWGGVVSLILITPLALLIETNHLHQVRTGGWILPASLFYSAVVVSILSHRIYYRMVQTYPANLVAPLTLMNPLMAIVFGVLITGDVFDWRMGIGTAVTLTGVFIITLRPNTVLPLAVLLFNKFR